MFGKIDGWSDGVFIFSLIFRHQIKITHLPPKTHLPLISCWLSDQGFCCGPYSIRLEGKLSINNIETILSLSARAVISSSIYGRKGLDLCKFRALTTSLIFLKQLLYLCVHFLCISQYLVWFHNSKEQTFVPLRVSYFIEGFPLRPIGLLLNSA